MNTRGIYINTMIFSIVAGIISLILLASLMFVPSSRVFVFGIATIEVGLVTIIVVAIVSIIRYERSIKALAQQGANYLVKVDTCPDYFSNTYTKPSSVQSTSLGSVISTASSVETKGGIKCSNGFTTPDGNKTYYFVKLGCSAVNASDKSCAIDSTIIDSTKYNIQLKDMANMKPAELCAKVNIVDPKSGYANIPWTDIKGRCNSLRTNGLV